MKSFIKVIAVILLALLFVSEAAITDDIVTKELFDEKYNNWIEWKNSPASASCSDSTGAAGIEWNEIIGLGIDAVPFIIEKMDEERLMVFAFIEITGILAEDELRPEPEADHEFKPKSETKGCSRSCYKIYKQWWKKERKTLHRDIEHDIKAYLDLKKNNAKEIEIEAKINYIKYKYGVFALPYAIDYLKKGETDILPVLLELKIYGGYESMKDSELQRDLYEMRKKENKDINKVKMYFDQKESKIKEIESFIKKYGSEEK